MRIQTQMTKQVPAIESLVASVVGADWVEQINSARERDGRRPYRPNAGDERAALALLAHAPGIRERWPAAARAASQLGGILNAAHHNDADRWNRGDELRAASLADELRDFLAASASSDPTSTWLLSVKYGTIPAGKRAIAATRTAETKSGPGQSAADVAARFKGSAIATSLVMLAAATAQAAQIGSVRVDYRDSTTTPAEAMTVTLRRSDATGTPRRITIQV